MNPTFWAKKKARELAEQGDFDGVERIVAWLGKKLSQKKGSEWAKSAAEASRKAIAEPRVNINIFRETEDEDLRIHSRAETDFDKGMQEATFEEEPLVQLRGGSEDDLRRFWLLKHIPMVEAPAEPEDEEAD